MNFFQPTYKKVKKYRWQKKDFYTHPSTLSYTEPAENCEYSSAQSPIFFFTVGTALKQDWMERKSFHRGDRSLTRCCSFGNLCKTKVKKMSIRPKPTETLDLWFSFIPRWDCKGLPLFWVLYFPLTLKWILPSFNQLLWFLGPKIHSSVFSTSLQHQ